MSTYCGDSALRDKAGSLWLASSIDTQVLSPCSPLHNPAFSSQNKRSGASVSSQVSLEILESQNGFTKQAQNLESTFQQSSHSPTAIPRILEKDKQAGREKSCREQTELESTFSKVDSRGNALSPSLRDFALAKSWQSTSNKNAKAQKVDSRIFTQAAQSLSTPQGKKAESVFSNQPQAAASLDSSKSPSDSKILDEKCGLQGKSQGSYLDGNDCRDFSPLPHFSLKAESPQVDSRIFTQTAQPAHHDSRNCGVASGAFCGFWGRARLEVCGYPKIYKIAAMDTQS